MSPSTGKEEEKAMETKTIPMENDKLFRSVAETADDGVFILNGRGEIAFCNKSAVEIFGYPREDLIGKPIGVLLHEDHRDILDETLHRTEAEGFFRKFRQVRGRTKNGVLFPLELSLSTWKIRDDRFYACILRDTTERHVTEAHTRLQAQILAQVKDAVVMTDREGRVTYWNPAAERLYGYKVPEAMGQPLDELLRSRWLKAGHEKAVHDALLSERSQWYGEAVQRRKDGREIHVESTISDCLDSDGRPMGRLNVSRDITERKRLEHTLLHNEKLAAMGQMAAGIAHDLKAPLSVICGYADHLAQAGVDAEEVRRHAGTIRKQAKRCADLIDNLLGFSRKERPDEAGEEFDARDALAFPLSLLHPHILKKSIRVERRVPDSPLPIRGHKDMLEQVIFNIARNAVDAMASGGRLTVDTSSNGSGQALIRVSDTGPGIPESIRDEIFEPFFTTKPHGRGTGVGLWLSREIILRFGGRIRFDSEPGLGTTFTIELPLAGGGRKTRPAASVSSFTDETQDALVSPRIPSEG
jgi:two-component system, cell cycle sensor histidine kinase and response regulator CckA